MRVVVRLGQPPRFLRGLLPAHSAQSELSSEILFQRLISSALETPYYNRPGKRELLEAAQSWEDLPTTSLREYWQHHSQFINPHRLPPRRNLRLPFESTGVTLVGGPDALESPRSHRAEHWWKLNMSETRLLAAPPSVLRRITAAVLAGELTLPKLDDAIVVLNSITDGALYSGERDLLWQVFGVPIFEQWIGFDGELIAWECDAHDGLHLNSPQVHLEANSDGFRLTSWDARRTPVLRLDCGFRTELSQEPCRCGHPSPLLLGLQNSTEQDQRIRSLVAVA